MGFVTPPGAAMQLTHPPFSPNREDRGLVLTEAEAIADPWDKAAGNMSEGPPLEVRRGRRLPVPGADAKPGAGLARPVPRMVSPDGTAPVERAHAVGPNLPAWPPSDNASVNETIYRAAEVPRKHTASSVIPR